jgi:hypothetical protein
MLEYWRKKEFPENSRSKTDSSQSGLQGYPIDSTDY